MQSNGLLIIHGKMAGAIYGIELMKIIGQNAEIE
jgi:hypothetical protein